MRKTLWNVLFAAAVAAGLCASSSALAASKKTPTPAADAADKTAKVNLNTADEKDIAAAKGVGDKLAKELVAGRPYKTWDEVSKVKGVGSGKKLDALKKVLKLSEGVAAKDVAADTKDTKSKSSSKAEEKKAPAAPAAAGAAAGGAAATGGAGSTASTGKASAAAESSSPSKKSPSSSSSEKAAASKLAPGEMININTATAEELDKLPEIGPTKAKAIVDYRAANGKFASIQDIMKVSGIKEGTFAKIKDHIVVK
ncbi:MAG TPA: helix-hairpin-helix domain-containing protein [Thermoanaerobaculia bacterium]|nr:helix-hairpin-helix domain-containing protein [Thermoanaerobaculia bacterium]